MTYRDGGRVKTKNKYLGPASGGFGRGAPANLPTAPTKTLSTSTKTKTPKLPTDIPIDANWSDPFWDTPHDEAHLRQQAKVLYDAYVKRAKLYKPRTVVDKLLGRNQQPQLEAEMAKINDMKTYLINFAHGHFERRLEFTSRGVVLARLR